MDTGNRTCVLSEYAMELVHHKARQIVGKGGFRSQDVPDIKQELALDLLERLPKYDPEKATNNTFVARLVEHKISKMIRDRKRERRDRAREECSIHDEVNDEDGVRVELGTTVSEDEQYLRTGKYDRTVEERRDMAMDVAAALADLPPDLREVAEALSTLSVTEACRKLGFTRAWLYKEPLPRLRKALEERGLGGYL